MMILNLLQPVFFQTSPVGGEGGGGGGWGSAMGTMKGGGSALTTGFFEGFLIFLVSILGDVLVSVKKDLEKSFHPPLFCITFFLFFVVIYGTRLSPPFFVFLKGSFFFSTSKFIYCKNEFLNVVKIYLWSFPFMPII